MSERLLRNPFEDRTRCACSGGRGSRDKMQLVDDPDRGKVLQKVGETDQYQKIQSFIEGCDIRYILERCMISGDYSSLQKMQGTFADITGYDADPRTIHNLMAHARGLYEGLDSKTKAHFTDFDDFLEQFAIEENLKKYIVTDSTVNEEVKADES